MLLYQVECIYFSFLAIIKIQCTLLIDVTSCRYVLTAAYLVAIQYYTRIGGKVSVILIKYENNQGEQSSADSLIYKVNTFLGNL
jgi:hypothetical protein